MAETVGPLGQASPGAAATADLYAAPAATQAVASSLCIANTGAAAALVRVHHRLAAAATGPGNAIVYGASVSPGEVLILAVGEAFAPTDVCTVWAEVAGVTFTLFGVEIT